MRLAYPQGKEEERGGEGLALWALGKRCCCRTRWDMVWVAGGGETAKAKFFAR